MQSMSKNIVYETDWDNVIQELETEDIKLSSYDRPLLDHLGDVSGKKILDYGCGPGMLAQVLQKNGALVQVWDINPDMLLKARQRIGLKNVFDTFDDIPSNFFDIIICNLVLCIVSDSKTVKIMHNIKKNLNKDGSAYVGFSNPKIFNVYESNLDLRLPIGASYDKNHIYSKIKKEGGYTINEFHRPIEWYVNIFNQVGLRIDDIIFTPEYELNGKKIKDFIIFKLTKK